MSDIVLYVPDSKLYPTVKDIVIPVFKNHPDVDEVHLYGQTVDRTMPLLGLGGLPEVANATQVKTLSQKQLMSNPAAITELEAAISSLLTPRVYPKVGYAVVDGLTDEEERSLGRVLVVDIETGGNYNKLLPEEMYLISVAIYDGDKCYVFTEECLRDDVTDSAREQLIRILTSGRKLVAHNMKFDFRTLSSHLGVTIKGHLDTMVLHYLINPGAKEHGLKPLCRKYVGADDWEALAKQYTARTHNYASIPREILYHYNAFDVIWTWRLMKYLMEIAEGDARLEKLARFGFTATNFLQDVEKNGAGVDIGYLLKLKLKYEELKDNTLVKLQALTGNIGPNKTPFNPNSPQQVQRYLKMRGIEVSSTAEGVLEDLRDAEKLGEIEEEFVDLLLDYRGYVKMLGVNINGILSRQRNGIVYPTFKFTGTNTGRLSAADPNIQNIPREKELRNIFIARSDDRTLVQVDYSQAELRVMAVLSKDEYLISLFQPEMGDFFDSLMPSAFPRADISSWTKQEAKDNRAKLKATIYGLSYNRKAKAIAKDLKISIGEAQAIINNYFKVAPDLYEWRAWVSEMAIQPDQTLVTQFGRYYQAEVVTGRNKQSVINSGLAFLPQSTASDLCLTAAIEVAKWIDEYDGKIIALIHDAILIDAPKTTAQAIAARVQEEMRESGRRVFGDVVPFATDASFGRSWGDCN